MFISLPAQQLVKHGFTCQLVRLIHQSDVFVEDPFLTLRHLLLPFLMDQSALETRKSTLDRLLWREGTQSTSILKLL